MGKSIVTLDRVETIGLSVRGKDVPQTERKNPSGTHTPKDVPLVPGGPKDSHHPGHDRGYPDPMEDLPHSRRIPLSLDQAIGLMVAQWVDQGLELFAGIKVLTIP